jgi:SAM-dependent methyltransferase
LIDQQPATGQGWQPLGHLDHDEPVLGYHRLVADLAMEAAPHGGAVVDLGCGPGQILELITDKRLDIELWGVDGDPECVRRSKLRAPEAVVVQGDIVDPILPASDGPVDGFDVVTSSHALEHLTDPVGALSHWRNLLTPGGRLVVAVPNALQPILIARALARRAKANPGHFFIWDRATFDNFCRLAGFRIVDRRVDYVPLVPYRIRRTVKPVAAVERALLRPLPQFANSHIVVLEPIGG